MNKFTSFAAAAFVALAAGCATGPISNLPMVDVSKMENGKVLTAPEIDAAVRGKQVVGNIIRTNGNKVQDVIYVFEANGSLKGMLPGERDVGKWYVDYTTNTLCNTWVRWMGSCGRVTVVSGKLHLFNPASGGQYLQQ